jgi:hypothetical protein
MKVIATAGLAVATVPDFAHYILFFWSMATHNDLVTGLVTVLVPSVTAMVFILLALLALYCIYQQSQMSRDKYSEIMIS